MKRRLAAIPVDKVRVPKNALRALDEAWAETLGAMMAEEGQAQPIEVAVEGDRYELVFGLHRLEGARRRKLRTIDALIDEAGGDAASRRRRAIHENLGRRELSKLDRAVHIAELHGLMKDERGERRGGDRRSADARSKLQTLQFWSLGAEVAERVGLSERSVAIAVSIAHGIAAAIRLRIVSTPALRRLADNQGELEKLALEPDARQTRILDLVADEKSAAKTVADAIAELDGERKPSETERYWQLAENAFARLAGRTLDRFFAAHEAEFRDWLKRKEKR